MDSGKDLNSDFIRIMRLLTIIVSASVLLMAAVLLWGVAIGNGLLTPGRKEVAQAPKATTPAVTEFWRAPEMVLVSDKRAADEINYGRELIAHTAKFLGPGGSVMQMSNGMNCQNCHLDAGTKTFGNNYSAVASTYPKYRARSGSVESIEKRVNDCFERSLNGNALDSASREMRAIVSYIEWLGTDVKKGEAPKGSGLFKIEPLARAADPSKGKALYEAQCVACHGKDGQGLKLPDGTAYQYPPLWGDHSYNQGAGLFRLSTFAQFIYTNMPLGATYDRPLLSKEEAWDIAAYVNSLPRPGKDISKDWPDIGLKPFDHPFGPYEDPFSEAQHKFGPFDPIKDYYAKKKSK